MDQKDNKIHSFQHVFKYCPACGAADFIVNNEKSKKCNHCGFVYYFNASAAVAAFIMNNEGELLVCKRKKDPAKGTLDLPGGFIDADETAEQAIAREIKEELNIETASPRYLFSLPNIYRYSGLDIQTLDMFFEVQANDFSTLQADDDVEEAYFIPIKKLKPADFGLLSIQQAISKWQKEHTIKKEE